MIRDIIKNQNLKSPLGDLGVDFAGKSGREQSGIR
jgi:hypothetical protein